MRFFGHGMGYTEKFHAEINSLKPMKDCSLLPWSVYSENFEITGFRPEIHN